MYCPKCGTHNLDNVSYCRSCGATLSLIPQALTGRFGETGATNDGLSSKRRRRERTPSLEGAIRHFCIGLGFLLAAIVLISEFPRGILWGWTFFIPAFSMIGKGIGEYVQLKQGQKSLPPIEQPYIPPPSFRSAQNVSELPPQHTVSEGYTPSSVTEGTTKLLDREQ